MQVHYLCAMGTSMQVKFEAAMMTCNPNATMEMAGRMLDPTSRRAKKPSKKTSKKPSKKPSRKPSKKPSSKPTAAPIREECLPCPTMQDMEDMMMEKMSTEICVLQAAGWIDAEGNHMQVKTGLGGEGGEGGERDGLLQDVVDADIAELPVAEALSEQKVSTILGLFSFTA